MPAPRHNRLSALGAAQAGRAQSEQAAQQLGDATFDERLPLAAIEERAAGNTRPANAWHVVTLAESMAVLGLLEPLVVDRRKRLLAGLHRFEAARLLEAPDASARLRVYQELCAATRRRERPEDCLALEQLDPTLWHSLNPGGRIPVRMMDFDSATEPARALQVEIAENEKRRDYSSGEVKLIVERLRGAGFVEVAGRPKAGEKPLRPALAVILGKSRRHINRLLASEAPALEASATRLLAAAASATRALQRLQRTAKRSRRPLPTPTAEAVAATLAALRDFSPAPAAPAAARRPSAPAAHGPAQA